MKNIIRIVLMSIGICYFFDVNPAMAFPSDTVTVLATSHKFENVTYRADFENKRLEIDQDGWQLAIDFSDIVAVYAKDGSIITDKVIGRGSKSGADSISTAPIDTAKVTNKNIPEEEHWVSRESKIIKNAKKKRWSVGLRGASNYSIPSGQYYEGIKSGLGYEGELLIALDYDLALMIGYSRSGLKLSDDFTLYSLDPDVVIISQKHKFKAERLCLSVINYKPINKGSDDLDFWYLLTGIARVNHVGSSDMLLENDVGNRYQDKMKFSEPKFAMTLGVGLAKSIQKNLFLDLSFHWDLVFAYRKPESNSVFWWNNYEFASIYDFRCGLIYLVNND